MKQLINKKWVLSALLITALGSQYHYSVSSQELIGQIDLSSRAIATTDQVEQTLIDATQIISAAVSGTETVSATGTATVTTDGQTVPPPPAPPTASDEVRTESADAEACNDCVVLTREQAELIRRALTRMAEAPAATDSEDAPRAETPAERLRREREERAAAREEAAELAREREAEERETRNEEFNTKMEEAVERCERLGSEQLSCVSRRYTSLLRRYTGRKAISTTTAQAAYRAHIEPLLRTKLSSMDDTSPEAQETIAALMQDVPSEYSGIKNQAVLLVRMTSEARANSIKATLTEAKTAADNRDFQTSQALLMQANQEHGELRADLYGSPMEGRQGILDSINTLRTSDSSAWAFAQSNLISPVRSLFTGIESHNNSLFNAGLSTTPGSTTNGQPAVDNSRTSVRGSDQAGPALPNSSIDLKMGVPQQNQNNGVIFNQPTPNMTGTRQPRN